MFNKISSLLVDVVSIGSLVGIWPRYVEPQLLKKTFLKWSLSSKYKHLNGLKIVHFTDLHFHALSNFSFLKKIKKAILEEKSDVIVFTGDFLCYARLEKEDVLKEFLSSLKAPLGSFCVFGNHDYASYVSRNNEGNYVIKAPINPIMGVYRSMQILCSKKKENKGHVSEEVKKIPTHKNLVDLLKHCHFQMLENETHLLPIGLNIVGLGEYTLGRTKPDEAFSTFNHEHPGLVLVHNPDAFPQLANYPGDLVLSGHTHGEQIHISLPILRKISQRLVRLENPEYTRGLYHAHGKKLYVNRGVGCHKPFRLGSIPEILVITIDA